MENLGRKSKERSERRASSATAPRLKTSSENISSSTASTEANYKIIELKGTDPAFEEYFAFIMAFWLRGLKFGSEFFRAVDSLTYFQVYSKVIKALLKRPDCIVRLAVLADEPDTAIGWSVSEGKVLHFVYVKREARRQGVGMALLPKSFETATHMTKIGKSIWKAKFKHVKFNPF